MSSITDYNELLPEIKALTPEKTAAPTVPVDVFVQEAENLYHWSQDDHVALEAAGLAPELITKLPVRAGACREAQSLWIKERNMRQQGEQDWKDQSPAAFDLRDHLLHAFRYAFRNEAGLLGRVDEIAQGDSNSDMVQDLNDLSALGKANLDLLTPIGITLVDLDGAATLADTMGNLLGICNGERKSDSEAMIIRDKAYTYLKQAIDEIRECGKYVFWRNPDRCQGYTSDYWKKVNSSREKTPAEAPV